MTTTKNTRKKYTRATFIASKKILTDQKEIATFLNTYGTGYDKKHPYPAVYVYADCYYIYQQKDGTFLCEIANCYEEGTLEKCEVYLWKWAKDEL